jgi:hypothetical protein
MQNEENWSRRKKLSRVLPHSIGILNLYINLGGGGAAFGEILMLIRGKLILILIRAA